VTLSAAVPNRVIVSPTLILGLCSLVGLATGVVSKPLVVVGALCGAAFFLVALVAPVVALTIFVIATFLSQISGVGASLSVAKGAGAALALAWIYRELVSGQRLSLSPGMRAFTFTALAFVIWGLLSATWATDPHAAITATGRLAQGPLLVLVVVSIVRTQRALLTICIAFICGAALSALAGIAGLTSPAQDLAASGRLSGGISDPNYLAAVLVPAIVLSLFLALSVNSTAARVAIGLSGGLSTIGLFLTQSRGGVIALAVATVGAVAVAGQLRRKVVLVMLIVGAFASFYLLLIAPPQSFSHVTAFTSNGGTGRTDLWTVAAKTFEKHPLNGIGAGNFVVVEPKYAVDINSNLPRADLVVQNHEPVHNTYLHVASELGLVGLILFLLLVGLALRACWRRTQEMPATLTRAVGSALFIGSIGMLVAFTFLTAQYEKQLWLVIAMLFAFGATPLRAEDTPRVDPASVALRRQ
jgi:putative inorganic carbon (HCO3(-)) transporter